MREVAILGHKGRQEFEIFAARVAVAQNLRHEVERNRFRRGGIGLYWPVKDGTADHQEVAGSRGDRTLLDLGLTSP